MAAWTADSDGDGDTLARCGHCDNCTRPPETIDARDVTLDAWRVLRVVQRVAQKKRYVTLPMLTDLVRGAQNERTLKLDVDVHAVAGGKVALRKEVRARAGARAVPMRVIVRRRRTDYAFRRRSCGSARCAGRGGARDPPAARELPPGDVLDQ